MDEVFSEQETLSLNAYQESGYGHPYTCPNEHSLRSGGHLEEALKLHATPGGLVCWWPMCEYEQQWAHKFTKDWSWLEMNNSAKEGRR